MKSGTSEPVANGFVNDYLVSAGVEALVDEAVRHMEACIRDHTGMQNSRTRAIVMDRDADGLSGYADDWFFPEEDSVGEGQTYHNVDTLAVVVFPRRA